MEKKKLSLSLDESALSVINRGGGNYREPIFAFVTPAKNGTIEVLTDLTYCRESICEYIRQEVRDLGDNGIDLKKLHMIIYRKVASKKIEAGLKIFQDQVITGQQMVNAIEKHYGWPLTKIYPTTIEQHVSATNIGFYYVTASKRWIKSPAMLSLFTLLFRIAANNRKYQFKNRIRSMKSLFKVLDELAIKSSYSEVAYYRTHGKRWKLVLDNYKKLFGRRSMEDMYYPPDSSNGYFFSEGINSLCDESSKDNELNKAFCKIVKKHNREVKKKV